MSEKMDAIIDGLLTERPANTPIRTRFEYADDKQHYKHWVKAPPASGRVSYMEVPGTGLLELAWEFDGVNIVMIRVALEDMHHVGWRVYLARTFRKMRKYYQRKMKECGEKQAPGV